MDKEVTVGCVKRSFCIIPGILILRLSLLTIFLGILTVMPGESRSGEPAASSKYQNDLSTRLRSHVESLAVTIGERNAFDNYKELILSQKYISRELEKSGYKVVQHNFEVGGRVVSNLEVSIEGHSPSKEIIVVGAHYDSAENTPAANDNGSGVAALLELARALKHEKLKRTVRFVFFVNEEPPYFHTEDMGSLRYAKSCRKNRDNIIGMLSLETIGYYSDTSHSQRYPPLLGTFYPDKGNFIAFVGNLSSADLVRKSAKLFRNSVHFPSEGVALPGFLTGIDWSDHWSFWQAGYHAVMITDTAIFRYPYYHTSSDTPDKLDFSKMATVTLGLKTVIQMLASEQP